MSPHYLRRGVRGWQFRRAVPQHLRQRFKRTEIVRSLTRITQAETLVRARALGAACEALFMLVERDAGITTEEIGQLTEHYLRNQNELFERRLDELPRGLRPSRRALQDEAVVQREVAEEMAFTVAHGGTLFPDATVAALAAEAGIDPPRNLNDRHLRDALALAALRHQESCADRLKEQHPTGIFARLARSARSLVGSLPDSCDDTTDTGLSLASTVPDTIKNVPGPSQAGSPIWNVRDQPQGKAIGKLHLLAEFSSAGNLNSTYSASAWTACASTAPLPTCPINATFPAAATSITSLLKAAGNRIGEATCSGGSHFAPILRDDDAFATPSAQPLVDQQASPSPMEIPCDGRFSTIWSDFVEDKIRSGEYESSRRPELKATFRMVVWLAGFDPMMTELTPTLAIITFT